MTMFGDGSDSNGVRLGAQRHCERVMALFGSAVSPVATENLIRSGAIA